MRASLVRLIGYIVPLVGFLAVADCGGGGGDGGDYVGSAQVDITASPSAIDIRDRMEVRTYLTEVNETGIMLKFRYPRGLTYVLDSSALVINNREIDISPAFNVESEGNFHYLVFFLSQDDFDKDHAGEVTFKLSGEREVEDTEVEVDPDVDDPLIDNDVEFDSENPDFQAEAAVGITVKG